MAWGGLIHCAGAASELHGSHAAKDAAQDDIAEENHTRSLGAHTEKTLCDSEPGLLLVATILVAEEGLELLLLAAGEVKGEKS